MCQFCDTDFVGTDGLGGGFVCVAEILAGAVRVSLAFERL
jgi:hypothetical protein